MNKPAAIYARVSSDRQKENHTIASQTATLIEYAQKNGYSVAAGMEFSRTKGYSGAILVRPGLEALRDVWRLRGRSPRYWFIRRTPAESKVCLSGFTERRAVSRCGVELIFLKACRLGSHSGGLELLVQFQGMIAEYERAQIAERCRRGKKHMAQQGGVNVLSGAPYAAIGM